MASAPSFTKSLSRNRPLQAVMQAELANRRERKSKTQDVVQRVPRILCIDDDPEICRTLEMRLGEYNAEVLVAFFGTQGFWEAITDHPDLILMDVGMPSGDGRFVLQSLRHNRSTERIPVIVLTGMRDPKLKNEMLNLGADRFLNKPIHFDALLSEMRSFVEIQKLPS